MSLLVAMLGASLAVGNVVQGAGELPAIWLEVQRGGRRLELVGDRHLEMNGAGRLTFRRDGRVIDLPPGATVLVDGRTASAKESVRLGQKVRVVDTEGRTLWSLASVPQAATLPEPVSFQAGPRAHRELVASYSALFVPVAEAMARKGYGNWETTLNEHVIRAVTARLAFREVGEDAGQAALSKEKGEGFPYVEALAERLVEYETNRERYPTFADFFPQLLEALEGVAGC